MPCIANSLHTLCSNHGAISIPIVKPTVLVVNPPLKHTNPQFYIGKTEVRSRALWDVGGFLGSKIASVGHPGAQKTVQIAERAEKAPVFPRISAIFFITYLFNCFHDRCYAKITESFILQWETIHLVVFTYPFLPPKTEGRSRSDCHAGPYWDPKSPLCGPSGAQKTLQIAERAEKAPVFPRISAIFFITYPFNCFHDRCYATNTESFILQWETTHFLVLTYPF